MTNFEGNIIRLNAMPVNDIPNIQDFLLSTHSHKPWSEKDVKLKKTIDQMVTKVEREPDIKPGLIYDTAASKFELENPDDANDIPDFESVQTKLYRRRRRTMPALPTVIDELEIATPYDQTLASSPCRFLLADETLLVKGKMHRLVVYASDARLSLLAKCDRWNVDGTFALCPGLFAQLYIIMGLY